MCDFVRHQIKWHMKEDDGFSQADKMGHLGIVPDDPEIDESAFHILQWFYALNAKRQAGFSGPASLTFSDIDAWQRLTGTITRPEEIEAIMAMDSAYLEAVAEKRNEGK